MLPKHDNLLIFYILLFLWLSRFLVIFLLLWIECLLFIFFVAPLDLVS